MKAISSSSQGIVCICMTLSLLMGCSRQERDRQIKADLTIKAKEDINFVGLSFTVLDGRVRIWGSCPTINSRDAIRQKLASIHVIKALDEHIIIAPLTIGSELRTKQLVDSVLADFPTVTAVVADNSLIINGMVNNDEVEKLMMSVKEVISNIPTVSRLKITSTAR